MAELILQPVSLAQVSLRLAHDEVPRVPFPLPLEPNTVWEEGPDAALWLGPDEWLITDAEDPASDLVTDLEQALAGVHHSAIDVSANRAVFDLTMPGPQRMELLATGCSIDLDPSRWVPGRCAQTLLGKVPVLLQERETATRLFVRPSYAGWLAAWLTAAERVRALAP
jgi:sarcosine oxidase subunit gamma